MLDIIDRLGRLCFYVCFTLGILILVLGVLVQISSDGQPVYVFYYMFGPVLLAVGYVIKYVLCRR